METFNEKAKRFLSPEFALKSKSIFFDYIKDKFEWELLRCSAFVCDKNHFGTLPEEFECYTLYPNYDGHEFTNYVILPKYLIKLIEVYPETKEMLAYRAYEVSEGFPKDFPQEYTKPKRPKKYGDYNYTQTWRINKAGLPQKVQDEIIMLERRIPQWLTNSKRADQRCSLILKEYLLLEKMNDGKVFRDELAKVVGEEMIRIHEKDTFDICFNDMCAIREKGYGKTFQVENEEGRKRVYLWCFAEDIIRRIEDPDYTEDMNEIDKLLSML